MKLFDEFRVAAIAAFSIILGFVMGLGIAPFLCHR